MEGIETRWGSFHIGEEVMLSEEGMQNEAYDGYFEIVMIIEYADINDVGLGVEEPTMSFKVRETNRDVPFSLYGYEITSIIREK